jgi:hypothetical protein
VSKGGDAFKLAVQFEKQPRTSLTQSGIDWHAKHAQAGGEPSHGQKFPLSASATSSPGDRYESYPSYES